MRDPAALVASLEAHCRELDRVGKLLDQAVDTYKDAETHEAEQKERFDEAYEDAIAAQIEAAANSEDRLPSDPKMDVLAKVDCREQKQFYQRAQRLTKRARREKEKLEKAQSREADLIGGAQSILKTLREEASVPNVPQPQWSGRAA